MSACAWCGGCPRIYTNKEIATPCHGHAPNHHAGPPLQHIISLHTTLHHTTSRQTMPDHTTPCHRPCAATPRHDTQRTQRRSKSTADAVRDALAKGAIRSGTMYDVFDRSTALYAFGMVRKTGWSVLRHESTCTRTCACMHARTHECAHARAHTCKLAWARTAAISTVNAVRMKSKPPSSPLLSPPLPSFLLDCPWGFVGDVCDSGGTAYQNGQVGFFAECLLVNIQVTSEHRRSAARLAAKYDSANYPIIGLDI